MISQILFTLIFIAAISWFTINVRKIVRNIRLGRDEDRSDQPGRRLKTMLLVALGQKKMFKRPIPALLHLLVYLGFVIINIEMLEIILDGILGTHRLLSVAGAFYNFLIAGFEWLALLVILACALFLVRRNLLRLKRFSGVEMSAWPSADANYILAIEIMLMLAFLTMNAADYKLQSIAGSSYPTAGSFPISQWLTHLLPESIQSLHTIERSAWWIHIIGVLGFLNYLPYSKHLHIVLAFPNTYFAKLEPQGKFEVLENVRDEVKAIFDPSFSPPQNTQAPARFGAKDVSDLSWKSLLDAYTCTECGRCTSVCPANITGKLLSPRKILMDTRDRMEEIGKNMDQNGSYKDDGKSLLDDYISREEIWACTSCNACVEACPVTIDPLRIITELRQFAVMEEAQAPAPINVMFTNTENNGAPWKYAQSERANWRNT